MHRSPSLPKTCGSAIDFRLALHLPESQSAKVEQMAFAQEQKEALHLLRGIENGTLSVAQASHLVDEADPALVYFIFTWLRTRYEGHPASEGVVGRLVELTQGHSNVKKAMSEGKQDSIVAWFEEEHSYKEFSAEEFIEVVVEKLEG